MEGKKEAGKSKAQMREIHINTKDPESIRVGLEQLQEDLLQITEDFCREKFTGATTFEMALKAFVIKTLSQVPFEKITPFSFKEFIEKIKEELDLNKQPKSEIENLRDCYYQHFYKKQHEDEIQELESKHEKEIEELKAKHTYEFYILRKLKNFKNFLK